METFLYANRLDSCPSTSLAFDWSADTIILEEVIYQRKFDTCLYKDVCSR